jgi:hypothetical protein
MENRPPRIPVTISGVGPEDGAHLMQKVADELGLNLVFQPGSNPTVIIQIGAAVKEQNTSHTSSSVGDISGSTIGSIGSARDVTVFAQNVEGASLPDDVKHALIEASKAIENLNLSAGLKEDIAGDLTKVANEIQKAQPDEGRLRHLLRNIKDVAAPVASALSIAASLAKLLT